MSQLKCILVVSEERTATQILERLLTQRRTVQGQLYCRSTLSSAFDCLREEPIDLWMIDLAVLEGLSRERVKQVQAWASRVPLIILGDGYEEELAMQATQVGAQDYLVKWPGAALLHRVIRYNLEQSQLAGRLSETEERIKGFAHVLGEELWDWNLETGELWRMERTSTNSETRSGFVLTSYDAWLKRVHPGDREDVDARLHAVLGGDECFWRDQFRFRCAKGHYRHVLDRGQVMRDKQGNAVRMIGAVVDLPEQKQLVEVRGQYRTAGRNTGEGIWKLDLRGKTTSVNECVAEILDYRSEEMIRRFSIEFINPVDQDEAGHRFVQRQQGMKHRDDLLPRRRNDAAVRARLVVDPYLSDEGSVQGTLELVTDLTEKKERDRASCAVNQMTLGAYSSLFEKLTSLAQTLATARDLQAVYRFLKEFVVEAIPCDRIHVSQYDVERGALLPVYAYRDGQEIDVETLSTIPLDDKPQSTAVRDGEIVISDDLGSAPRANDNGRDTVESSGARTSIAVPMIVLGRVIGSFEVQSDRPSVYGQEHITAMGMAANLAAMATENVRLLEQERQLRLATEASEQRFRGLVQNASDLITILDEDGRITYNSPSVERILGYSPEEVVGKSIFDFIHPGERAIAERNFSELARHPGRTMTDECRFRHKDDSYRILEATCSNLLHHPGIQGIVANARDVTHRKQRERELEALTTMASALRAAQQPTDIPPILVRQLQELLQTDTTALVMHEPVTGDLIVELGTGRWSDATGARLPRGRNVSERVIASGKPYASNQAMEDADLYHHGPPTGLNATACVPLIAEEKAIGALWIARQSRIADHEVRLLAACGDIAAGAIHRATLHEQTEQRVQRLAALHAIDVAISSTFDLNVTLNVFLDHLRTQLEVDAAVILLFNRHLQALEYTTGCGFSSNLASHSSVRIGIGFAGEAALERRMVHVTDFAQVPERMVNPDFAKLLASEQIVSYLAVPLIAKGQIQGVLELFHRSRLNPTPEWLEFLNTLAAQGAIAIDNATLYNDLQRSNTDLSLAYDATIEGWSRALDLRDHETEGHSARVTQMTLELARRLNMSEQELAYVRWGSLLHDIGKMGVPDSILLKAGPLNKAEWEIMRRHPSYAYELLSPISFLRPALDIPYCHHEKWDGSGYPRGLEGEQIPLPARIFAIVDVWDALSSDRPYRSAWPQEAVLHYIEDQAGQHFDPDIVEVFLQMMR